MSATRFARLQKATALVPLALLSAAWTVNVTGLTLTSAAANDARPATLPDGTTIPSQAIAAPASVSGPADSTPGMSQGQTSDIVATASTSGIPAAALAAYQRAASVIDSADKTCHIDWPLIAAIGRVESNHGRANGNRLSPNGVSTPGIFGPALNGHGVALIRDTDSGQFDGDTQFDRAVGPMQFIPSTWSMVGVDADADGKRNPQDINDAALATAVYLCSGSDDLSTPAGQRAAVFRYNHSQSYVTTVLAIANAYRSGDYTSVPNSTVTSDYVFEPNSTPSFSSHPVKTRHEHSGVPTGVTNPGQPSSAPSSTSTPQTHQPTSTTSDNNNGGTKSPTKDPVKTSSPTPTPSNPVGTVTQPVKTVMATPAQIAAACQDAIQAKFGVSNSDAVQKCVNAVGSVPLNNLNTAVSQTVASLADVLKNLLGGLLGGLGGVLGGN